MKAVNFIRRSIVAALFLPAIFFAGCDDDKPENTDIPGITVAGDPPRTQTLEAGQTSAAGITFTTTAAWTSTVKVNTGTAAWLRVSPASGDRAGEYTVSFALDANTSPESRAADVTFTCGETEVTFSITQEGTTVVPVTERKITFRVQRLNEAWRPGGDREPYMSQGDVVITVSGAGGESFEVRCGVDGAELMHPEGDYTYRASGENGLSNMVFAGPGLYYVISGMITTQEEAQLMGTTTLGYPLYTDINGDGLINDDDRAAAAPLAVSADASVDVYVMTPDFKPVYMLYNEAFEAIVDKEFYGSMIRYAYMIDASLTHEYQAIDNIYHYTFTSAEDNLTGLWNHAYYLIEACNTVLQYMDEMPDPGITSGQFPILSEEERVTFAAAVRYYRAYAYYTLLNCYGGVPITDAIAIDAPIDAPRNTAEEVEAFIIAECDFVAANAPAFEPNMAFAVRQVKARVLMRGNRFQEASEALMGIINSGNFALPADPAEWGMDAMTSDAAAYLPSMMNKGEGVFPVRYTETLLLYVEAQTGAGMLNQQDLDRLNQLIAMQGEMPVNMGMPAEEIRAAIRNLWATELNMEGHTFARLKREGTFLAEMGPYGAAMRHQLLPIPQSALDANPNMLQNFGW